MEKYKGNDYAVKLLSNGGIIVERDNEATDSVEIKENGLEYFRGYSVDVSLESENSEQKNLDLLGHLSGNDTELEPDKAQRAEIVTYRILRDTKLARSIKEIHQNICQICAQALDLSQGKTYSEAHHIKPLGSPHNGPDIAGNIIVLCPNHHMMCDYGAIKLNSTQIRQKPGHTIDEEYIQYHNSIICNGCDFSE